MKRAKRWMSMVLAVAMVLTMIPAAFASNFEKSRDWSDSLFDDVTVNDWFYETVKNAYELDLMAGCGNGQFNPKGDITLAETLAIAARIHAITTPARVSSSRALPGTRCMWITRWRTGSWGVRWPTI